MESDDNAATDPLSMAENIESGEHYNEDSASLDYSDEQYDEDSEDSASLDYFDEQYDEYSDLGNANSQVSAELNVPPSGIPPINHAVPGKALPRADQNLAPIRQLYTKILG